MPNKFLSIDGGLTALLGGGSHWATGANYGDGEQASHWKDGLGIGVMSPTAPESMAIAISGYDVKVLM